VAAFALYVLITAACLCLWQVYWKSECCTEAVQ